MAAGVLLLSPIGVTRTAVSLPRRPATSRFPHASRTQAGPAPSSASNSRPGADSSTPTAHPGALPTAAANGTAGTSITAAAASLPAIPLPPRHLSIRARRLPSLLPRPRSRRPRALPSRPTSARNPLTKSTAMVRASPSAASPCPS